MTMNIKILIVTSLSLAMGFVWASAGTDGMITSLKSDDLAVVFAGESIYQAQCASCHGAQMQGQPDWRTRDENGLLPAPPHDETGHTWHHADDLLFEITKYGPAAVVSDTSYKTMMPAYKDVLSDDDIIAVLSFIKHSWPEKERSWHDEVNESQDRGIGSIKEKPSLLDRLFK